MITTYAGTELEILSGDIDAGTVRALRLSDRKVREYQLFEIRATDGLPEIVKALKADDDNHLWRPG